MQTMYRRAMSLAQKLKNSRSEYGQGFNYWVEVTFEDDSSLGGSRVEAVLQRLDHKALGIDVDLGFEPSEARLAAWIAEELGACEVRLERGDGYAVTWLK